MIQDDGDCSGDRLQQGPVLDRLFKVLLVEDDEFTLRVVERLLKSCDYEGESTALTCVLVDLSVFFLSFLLKHMPFFAVTLARNGREALDILDREDFLTDLILTDLMMPEVTQ